MVLGANGGLGKAVCQNLFRKNIDFIPVTRTQVDLSGEEVIPFLSSIKVDSIFNCAAYTDVDRAERDRQLALQVNARCPLAIAEYCADHDISMMHFSTDYVFSGESESLPTVESEPRPINFYGLSKLKGEEGVASFPKTTIIRTSWLYSAFNHSFPNKILAKVHEGIEFHVVDDEFGCPTWVDDLAAYSIHLLQNGQHGLFHGNGEGRVSRYQFAKRIERQFRNGASLIRPAESDPETPGASRPKFGGLCNTKESGWEWTQWDESFEKASKSF